MASTSAAAFAGPTFLLSMRNMSERNAMNDLLEKVDTAKFEETFSTTVDNAQMLIDVSHLPERMF